MPPPATPIEPVKTFDSIIQDLRTTYPQEKMSEISTSFCFICLLHLANEEGLKIETGRYDGQEGEDVGCMGMADDFEVEGDDPAKRWKRQKLDRGEKEDRVVGELQALKVFKDLTAGRAA
jgi:condensin complex subunit 2